MAVRATLPPSVSGSGGMVIDNTCVILGAMSWLTSEYRPIYRSHRWVFAVWLGQAVTAIVGVALLIASVVSAVQFVGIGSTSVAASLVLSFVHDWLIHRYSDKDTPQTSIKS